MIHQRKEEGRKPKSEEPTLLGGIDLGAGAAGGVDGLLVLVGGGVGRLLAHHDRLPVLPDRTNPSHLSLTQTTNFPRAVSRLTSQIQTTQGDEMVEAEERGKEIWRR